MRYDGARLADFSVSGDTKRRQSFDGAFFTLSMLLLLIGVIMVLSSSYARAYYDPGNVTGGNAAYYFVRQLIFALLGIGCMLLASKLPMGFYRSYALHFLLLTLVLLMLVPVIGVKANGSRRWLGIGGLTLQPSELAKLTMPTLVVCGTKDMIKESHTRMIAENIPNARLVILPGDHFVANRHPAEFNQVVDDFLNSV